MLAPESFQLPYPLDSSSHPPPACPKYLKHQVYDTPEIFEKVDSHAITVSQSQYPTFRDLMWDLVFRYKLSELERARVIFRWMTSKDMNSIQFTQAAPGSPEEVLMSFRQNKGTFARIYEVMCCYAQMNCITISGYAKGVEYLPGDTFAGKLPNHSWNVILIQGAWQLIDAHWATRYLSSDKNVPENVVYEYDDFYFVMEPQQAVYSHFPEDPAWQLLPKPLSLPQFENLPLTKSQFFKCGMDFLQQHHGVVQTQEGKLQMSLGFWKPGSFTYKLQYGETLSEQLGGVDLKSYALQETVCNQINFFFRLPAPGVYYLTIYAQELIGSVGLENTFRAACEYKILCDQAARDAHPYPACHDANWGPAWAHVAHYGLEPNHSEGVLSSSTGSVEIRFGKRRGDVSLLGKLRMNGVTDDSLDQYCVIEETEVEAVFIITLPQPGEYGLEIYANEPSEGDTYTHMCQYMLHFEAPAGYVGPEVGTPLREMYNYEQYAPSLGTLPRPYTESQYTPDNAQMDQRVAQMSLNATSTTGMPQDRRVDQTATGRGYLYKPGYEPKTADDRVSYTYKSGSGAPGSVWEGTNTTPSYTFRHGTTGSSSDAGMPLPPPPPNMPPPPLDDSMPLPPPPSTWSSGPPPYRGPGEEKDSGSFQSLGQHAARTKLQPSPTPESQRTSELSKPSPKSQDREEDTLPAGIVKAAFRKGKGSSSSGSDDEISRDMLSQQPYMREILGGGSPALKNRSSSPGHSLDPARRGSADKKEEGRRPSGPRPDSPKVTYKARTESPSRAGRYGSPSRASGIPYGEESPSHQPYMSAILAGQSPRTSRRALDKVRSLDRNEPPLAGDQRESLRKSHEDLTRTEQETTDTMRQKQPYLRRLEQTLPSNRAEATESGLPGYHQLPDQSGKGPSATSPRAGSGAVNIPVMHVSPGPGGQPGGIQGHQQPSYGSYGRPKASQPGYQQQQVPQQPGYQQQQAPQQPGYQQQQVPQQPGYQQQQAPQQPGYQQQQVPQQPGYQQQQVPQQPGYQQQQVPQQPGYQQQQVPQQPGYQQQQVPQQPGYQQQKQQQPGYQQKPGSQQQQIPQQVGYQQQQMPQHPPPPYGTGASQPPTSFQQPLNGAGRPGASGGLRADQFNQAYDAGAGLPSPLQAYRPEQSTANWESGPIQREPPKEFQPSPVVVQEAERPQLNALPPETSQAALPAEEALTQAFRRVDEHAVQISQQTQDNFNQLIWQLIYARNITDELEKVRVIFLWLCTKDLHKMNFDHVKPDSPEEILMGIRSGKSTYAQIFITLCRYAGLHCKLIMGYAKGAEYVPGMHFSGRQGQHSWNAVLVDGVWRLVDCHWAARRLIGKHASLENVRYELDMFYFLANPSQLIYTHYPHDSDWQLLRHAISLQEFESLAPVKSAFFKYNLELITHRMAVISGREELVLKVGYPAGAEEKLAFTFSMSFDEGGEEHRGVPLSRYGRQENVPWEKAATFYIRPPLPGAYKLLLYAKELAPDKRDAMYGAMCEYRLEAAFPERAALPPFPPCQNSTYGPNEVSHRYALEADTQTSCVRAERGTVELRFRLGAPLRMMAKLKSSHIPEDQLGRAILQRVVAEKEAVFAIFLPDAGEFGLEVYANDPQKDGNSYYAVWQYLFVADSASPVRGLPTLPPGYLGPMPRFREFGLEVASHRDPFIQTNTGDLVVQLRLAEPLRLMAQMIHASHDAAEDASAYVLQQKKDGNVYFILRFPHQGYFKLQIYGLPYSDTSESLPGVFNYLIEASQASKTTGPFPQQFAQWKEGCYLHSPLDGKLGANGQRPAYIPFSMDVPEATAVAVVIDDDWTQLDKNTDGAWEGQVYTEKQWGQEQRVSVCCNYGSYSASYSTLLEYSMV